MAQIVTITNPLTGQPAQVDQLDHTAQQIDDAVTRAIGYGLGGNAKFITSGSLNDYKDCGWYAWDEGVSNVPFAYGSCIILNKGSSWIVHQIAIAGYGQNICIRRYVNQTDSWDAWEWVNPPMQLGVEYRTTERYLGKPVYVMVVDCGSVEANTWKQVNNIGKNIKDLVRFSATGIEGNYGEMVAIPSDADGLQLRAFVNRTVINNIYVKFKCDQRSLSGVKFTLWYTKTTD